MHFVICLQLDMIRKAPHWHGASMMVLLIGEHTDDCLGRLRGSSSAAAGPGYQRLRADVAPPGQHLPAHTTHTRAREKPIEARAWVNDRQC